MSEDQLSGEEIIRQNMAAFDSGEELPYNEDGGIGTDPDDFTEESLEENERDDESVEDEQENPSTDDARHMSKEDWIASGKDPDSYLTPDEFKRAGDLRNESNLSLAKKLAQQESMMKEILSNQNQSITDAKEREREKVLTELRHQQAEAIEFSDTEKAVELERKIASHEAVEPSTDSHQQIDAGVQEWHAKNSDWYNVDPGATGMLNVELQRAQRQNLPFNEAIGPAMDKVKRQFHYLFDDAPSPESQQQISKKAVSPRPSAISEKSRKAARPAAKKRSFSELDPSMQNFARKAAKASGLSEQKYMEQMQ